jgi:hypothetical protein
MENKEIFQIYKTSKEFLMKVIFDTNSYLTLQSCGIKHLNTQDTLQTTFSLSNHSPLPQPPISKYPNGSKSSKGLYSSIS